MNSILNLPATQLSTIRSDFNETPKLQSCFMSVQYPTINSYYHLPAVPEVPALTKLFSVSAVSSFSTITSSTRARRDSTGSSSISPCGYLCYHLLVILSNICYDQRTLLELIETQKLTLLFDLFGVSTTVSALSSAILLVQKQLVRCLCIITATATESLLQIQLLRQHVNFPFF